MSEARRLEIHVQGIVQGVGFRPFVHRIANAHGLVGWVRNGVDGVHMEVQGPAAQVASFLETLQTRPPLQARITHLQTLPLPAKPDEGFRIVPSVAEGDTCAALPPDLAICADCRAEIAEPTQRRYRYPFTNCTQCGPRFTITARMPYDRSATTMAGFVLCPECEADYHDPLDRRFHAQPIACPHCGPTLRLLGVDGSVEGHGEEALELAARTIREGGILALKGLGGYQLLVDAGNERAVRRLRERKLRPEKPFAVMFPSLEALHESCMLAEGEAAALASPEAPILLLWRRQDQDRVCYAVAPGNPRIGAMLPNTPLHQILLSDLGHPVVCTSGNLTDEPICFDETQALERLGGIADRFLVHDRAILRPVDDSLARIERGVMRLLRRARGFTPLPLNLEAGPRLLALGGHLKVTAALRLDDRIIVSQHLGDLTSEHGRTLLRRTAMELLSFHDTRPRAIACDQHPDYASSRLAEELALEFEIPLLRIQHHHAHVAAVMAEHGIKGVVLGLAWDGSGYGPDGTIWGGEGIATDGMTFHRVAHLRRFSLPGGDRAVADPRRSALGILYETYGEALPPLAATFFSADTLPLLLQVLRRGFQAPLTSSMGRLFDAVAAISGVRTEPGFEGQAAMALEFAAARLYSWVEADAYPLPLIAGDPAVADWGPLLVELLEDREAGAEPELMSLRFHLALAELALAIAERAGLERVVLAGGCFQNALLSALVRSRLEQGGYEVFEAERFPPNDGGLSLGQAHVAACQLVGAPRQEGDPCV